MLIKGVCYNENDEVITEGDQTLYQVVDESGNYQLIYYFLSESFLLKISIYI